MRTLEEISKDKNEYRVYLKPDNDIYHDVIGSSYLVDENRILHIFGDSYINGRSYNADVWSYIRVLSSEKTS